MDSIEAKPLNRYPVIPGDGASRLLADTEAMDAVSVLRRLGYAPQDVYRAMRAIQYQDALADMGAELVAAKDRVTTMLQAAGLGFAASAVMRGDWPYLRSWLKERGDVFVANEAVKELEALLAMVEVKP
jgi:hypothetical protein